MFRYSLNEGGDYLDARDVIYEQVEKLQANVLVIGSHGYDAVGPCYKGSVKYGWVDGDPFNRLFTLDLGLGFNLGLLT